MSIEIGNEYAEAVHMDEAERIVPETIYNCWELLPINSGAVTISRIYNDPQETVEEKLKPLYTDGLVQGTELTGDGRTLVRYQIPLCDIKIPDKFPLGYQLTTQKFIDYLKFYESLDIPHEVILPHLQNLADLASMGLVKTIESIKKHDKSAPLPDIISETEVDYFNNYQRAYLLRLCRSFPETNAENPAQAIETILDRVSGYLNSALKDERLKEIAESLTKNQAFFGTIDANIYPLVPCPAIYHDAIVDSRFWPKAPYNGVIEAGVVFGNLATTENVVGDIDESAAHALRRKIEDVMADFLYKTKSDKILYAPPNMTNLFKVGIPAITEDVQKGETDLTLNEWGGSDFITMLLCTDPTRIDPEVIYKQMDCLVGKGSWFLATVDPQTSQLRRVAPKPREQWEYSTTRRINTPLP